MYKLITYRSRRLESNYSEKLPTGSMLVGSFNEIVEEIDDEPERKLTRKERKAQKKKLKEYEEQSNVKTYIIDGEEVEEGDLTEEELASIRASEMINKDSFYDALEPLDNGEYTTVKRRDKKMLIVLGGAFGAILIVALAAIVLVNMGGGI